MRKTINEILIEAKSMLKDAGIRTWALDAEILLAHVLSFSRVQIFTHGKDAVTKENLDHYKGLIYKRTQGVPTQYLTNEQEFMSLPFYVDSNVLIPRQDTEVLVETALDFINKQNYSTILDMCTGSGCIGISLAYYANNTQITAVDVSFSALKVAEYNAKLNHVENRISFVNSNLFENIPHGLKGQLDMIVSNPPYIPTEDMEGLMKEVRDYEPTIALDGGSDGMDFYRLIVKQGKEYLRDNGMLIFEIGYNQGNLIKEVLSLYKFRDISIKKDLSGLDRVAFGIK